MTTNTAPPAAAGRLSSIDVLRGLVMVIMALDHTRDFFSNATFDATDLTKTNTLLFLTRWITHFCAPVFVLLAGTGAYLSLESGAKSKPELTRFLVTRGLWLMILEVAVITPFGWAFSLEWQFTRLQVIWVIGASMVILGVLIQLLPPWWIAGLGALMIAAHNAFDMPKPEGLWKALHSMNFFPIIPNHFVASLYPLVPWMGVMMLGYGAGSLVRNRRVLLLSGLTMIGLFALLRGANLYGDPRPWTAQPSGLFTFLSIVNCNKYPPSLSYLLMTLGPALVLLSTLDGWGASIKDRLATFGRVPLFYYLLHLPLLHGLAVVFSWVQYGSAAWLFQDLMALRGSKHPLPSGYGYELWVVYLVWIAAIVLLFPACKWFAGVKKRNRGNVLLSYL